MSTFTVFQLQLFSTVFMTGVIWVVQIVQYPLLRAVGHLNPGSFLEVHALHSRCISFVVGPTMVFEFVTAGLLCYLPLPEAWPRQQLWANFALVVGVWAATFFVSVPLHTKLSGGFVDNWARLLVDTNWLRTILWTAKTILLFYLLTKYGNRALQV